MRCKRRFMHGKRLKRSALRFDFNATKDYSPKATQGMLGDKIAQAVTPQNMTDMIPLAKPIKIAKTLYNFIKS